MSANRLYGPLMQTEEEFEATKAAQRARLQAEQDAALRRDLKAKFAVPDEFMDLAVQIWWDGKED